MFQLSLDKKPAGDQPKAIKSLLEGVKKGLNKQTLLGVTGSGKTFTIANVIAKINKPTLVIAHNKTLAAQLTQEYREFFPTNSVHYFVSYYDYFQPEAYVPTTDTYIAKEAQINKEIDRLRHATTQALLTRNDVIVVASVSAIYGLGSPKEYEKVHLKIQKGLSLKREGFIKQAIGLYFERTSADLTPGKFRVISNRIEVVPTNEEIIYRISFQNDKIENITSINLKTRAIIEDDVDYYYLFPAKHFVTSKEDIKEAIKNIKTELKERLNVLEKSGKLLEKERLRRRTENDLSLIENVGYCNGIENYSRYFDKRKKGEEPYTLLSYFSHNSSIGQPDFLTIIDESHITLPQIEGMYEGDRSRKQTLIDNGFRLDSALDNRPLRYSEFEKNIGNVIYTSATPGPKEMKSDNIVKQIIRPTGLVDPILEVRPIVSKDKSQIEDIIEEAKREIEKKNRVLIVTLTKKQAEDLSKYLEEKDINSNYIHSDVKTIDRIEILTKFRRGDFDVLVGVNLLREGLDLPEVTLIGILDADKEGFLRNKTSLTQTIGRAARNKNGKVILYADEITNSLRETIKDNNYRRELQMVYNKKHKITPQTIKKNLKDITEDIEKIKSKTAREVLKVDVEIYKDKPKELLKKLTQKMEDYVADLNFEYAAIIRDEIKLIKDKQNVPDNKK